MPSCHTLIKDFAHLYRQRGDPATCIFTPPSGLPLVHWAVDAAAATFSPNNPGVQLLPFYSLLCITRCLTTDTAIYCCIINHPKISGSKQQFIISYDSVSHLGHSPLVLPGPPMQAAVSRWGSWVQGYTGTAWGDGASPSTWSVIRLLPSIQLSGQLLRGQGPVWEHFPSLCLHHTYWPPIDQRNHRQAQGHCGGGHPGAWRLQV